MLSLKKQTQYSTTVHNHCKPMQDVISIPKRFAWPVSHIWAVIGVGQQCITGNQWYVNRVHWSVLTSNRNHPHWPTLGKARTESQAGELRSSRDIMCSCCSFYPPFRRIRCSLWYSSHTFFRWAQVRSGVCSRALCDCLFCFVWPTIPHDHTLSLYLSHSIDCCNQTAGCSQAVRERRAIFHFCDPCWVEYSHFLHNQVAEWMRSQVKGETKDKHKSITVGKTPLPLAALCASEAPMGWMCTQVLAY